jgi:hypothetical protein
VAAEALDGTTPTDERRGILRRLHTGETQVVANCAVLTEGFDEPSIDCIITARPTSSRTLYRQMIGRGTRTWPTKRDCLVLDLVGNTRHGLVTVAGLFDLPPESLEASEERPEGSSVADAVEQIERARNEHARLVAERVDIFQRADLNWLELSPTRYVLSSPEGRVELRTSDRMTWSVLLLPRTGGREIVASGLTLEFAQGVAEDVVRKLGLTRLVAKDAPWRGRPASDKQIAVLRKFGLPYHGLTSGQASDVIAARVARRSA